MRESDLEFFFDPVCPFAWITSRWVTEVQALRQYDVSWKFISLRMVNDDRGYGDMDTRYKKLHDIGLQGLRIASAARTASGNDAVAAVYSAIGTAAHAQGRRAEAEANSLQFYATVLAEAGLPREWAESGEDTFHDEVIRFETFQALERTGWQRNSIKVGDRWYAYNRLDPAGSLLGLAAQMVEILNNSEDEDIEEDVNEGGPRLQAATDR